MESRPEPTVAPQQVSLETSHLLVPGEQIPAGRRPSRPTPAPAPAPRQAQFSDNERGEQIPTDTSQGQSPSQGEAQTRAATLRVEAERKAEHERCRSLIDDELKEWQDKKLEAEAEMTRTQAEHRSRCKDILDSALGVDMEAEIKLKKKDKSRAWQCWCSSWYSRVSSWTCWDSSDRSGPIGTCRCCHVLITG